MTSMKPSCDLISIINLDCLINNKRMEGNSSSVESKTLWIGDLDGWMD